MKKFRILGISVLLVMLISGLTLAASLPKDVDAWVKEHKIGPYQEEVVDYDAIYQEALKEPPVVVYAASSRGIAALGEGFYDAYPGIEVEWNTLGTSDSIERVIREQEAGIYNAGVLFASDMPTQANVLVPNHMVFPWVPSNVRDVIPEHFQYPLLAQKYEARVVFYNFVAYEEQPIDSWWDLTKPEWRRNVVIEDPRVSGSSLDLFTTFVVEADAMAAEYERVFGEPIQLTTPNAGYEFIKRLAENQPRFVNRDSDARFIGDRELENPPIAVSLAFSRIRDAGDPEHGNIAWTVATDLKPAIGMLYPTPLNIVYGTASPNSAKLVVDWLLGDENGGRGMAPWFVPGNWPSRIDVTAVPEHPYEDGLSWAVADLNFWSMDPNGIWDLSHEVLEFVMRYF